MFIHKVSLVSPKLPNTGGTFPGDLEVQGNVRGATGFGEVEEEKDENKMRAGHCLIPQITLIILNIGPVDTIYTVNP